MINDDDQIALERLLADDLSPEEATVLRSRIASEQALQLAWEEIQSLDEWVSHKERARVTVTKFRQHALVKATLPVEVDKPLQQSSNKVLWMRRLGVAAAVIALLGLGTQWWFSNQSLIDHRPLAREMAAAATDGTAINAYNAEDYEAALPLLISLNEENSRTATLIAQGVCLFELKRYEDALDVFRPLNGKAGTYQPAIDFYLGLVFFKQGQATEARNYLDNVPSTSYYFPYSQKLKEKI